MAHWAEIDENNIVLRVIVGDDNDPAGDEGYQWLIDNLGGTWVKTSFNSLGGVHYLPDTEVDENGQRIPSGLPHFRYNFAVPGSEYDAANDAFIPPKPQFGDPRIDSKNWVVNPTTFLWEVYPKVNPQL